MAEFCLRVAGDWLAAVKLMSQPPVQQAQFPFERDGMGLPPDSKCVYPQSEYAICGMDPFGQAFCAKIAVSEWQPAMVEILVEPQNLG